jgi:hypothetical protein
MFTFKVHKTNETTHEDFASALSCARSSIENVLFDHCAIVTVTKDMIKIDAEGLTAQECKSKIKGCFCDSAGLMYPEFRCIEIQQ